MYFQTNFGIPDHVWPQTIKKVISIILTSLNTISPFQSSARDFAQTQTSMENPGHPYSN